MYFPLNHFQKSKIDFESKFEKKMPIFIFYFFFKEFWSVFKKVKKWISHCIFKKWFDRRRVFFLTKYFSEKAKHPKICLSLGGSMPEAQIKQCPLTPSPIYEGVIQILGGLVIPKECKQWHKHTNTQTDRQTDIMTYRRRRKVFSLRPCWLTWLCRDDAHFAQAKSQVETVVPHENLIIQLAPGGGDRRDGGVGC